MLGDVHGERLARLDGTPDEAIEAFCPTLRRPLRQYEPHGGIFCVCFEAIRSEIAWDLNERIVASKPLVELLLGVPWLELGTGEAIVLRVQALDHDLPVRVTAKHCELIEVIGTVSKDFESLVDTQSCCAVSRHLLLLKVHRSTSCLPTTTRNDDLHLRRSRLLWQFVDSA